MAKDSQVLLKPSLFGGFQKKAVLSYIFDLNESTQDAQQKLNEQIEELTLSRDMLAQSAKDMESRLNAAVAELAIANDKLAGQSTKNSESEGIIDKLNSEIARQAELLAQKSGEITRHIARNTELEEQNKSLAQNGGELKEKREQLEQAVSQINGLLEKAKADADKIIIQARNDAAQITRAAHGQADGILEQAKASAQAQIRSSSRSFSDAYKQFEDFSSEIGGLQRTIIDAASTISAKMEALNSAVNRAKNIVPDSPPENFGSASSFNNRQNPPDAHAADTTKLADDILNQYGIRKDDSGFFRLAAEK